MNDHIKFHYKNIIFIYFFGGLGVYLLQLLNLLDLPFWYKLEESPVVVHILIIQFIIFSLSFYFFRSDFNFANLYGFHLNKRIQLKVLLVALLYIIFVSIYNFNYLFSDFNIRHSGEAGTQRVLFFFCLLLLLFVNQMRIKYSNLNITNFIIFFIIFISTIYPASTASRLVVVPILLQLIITLYKKNIVSSFLYLCLSFVFLYASLASRGEPSFTNFYLSIFSIPFEKIYYVILNLISFSFPGSNTLEVILESNYKFPFSYYYFPLYISPIPSSLLPSDILYEMSLSYPLGINRDSFSLNFDIYTEGYYWFGYIGLFLWPFIVASLILISERILNSRFCERPFLVHIFSHLSIYYLMFGCMVFTLRAGSRMLFVVIIFALLIKLFSKLKFKF